MAENKPQTPPDDESKKDTVRINLPPNITGKSSQKPGSSTQPVMGSDVTQPLAPPGSPGSMPVDVTQPITPPSTTQPINLPPGKEPPESKKETAVMGKPPATPAPKADTSRVQVPPASPSSVESPRPTVKLRREAASAEAGAAPAAATTAAPARPLAPTPPPSGEGAPSGADLGLAIATMLLSLGVVGYLGYLVYVVKL